jgi:amino acid transporter
MSGPAGAPIQDAAHKGSGPELARVIGFWGGVAVVVGTTIGSGIFRKPSTLAGLIHDPIVILALWAGFGAVAICGALALAELASMLPHSGGAYVYLRAAYGDSAAFVFGWLYLMVTTPATVGALATFAAELALGFAGVRAGPWSVPLVASTAVLLLAGGNLLGARLGSAIQSVLTVIKVSALLFVIVVGLTAASGTFAHLAPASGQPTPIAALGRAAASVIWAYDGWISVSMIAGEVRAPDRSLKGIIIVGMMVIVGLYLAANVGYFHALPVDEMARQASGVPQSIVRAQFGRTGEALIGGAILCSVLGALNGNVLTRPRVSYALARDGLTFGFLGRVHPRWGTPHVSLILQAIAAIVLIFALSDPRAPGALFDKLTTYFVVVEWFALLFAVAAVIVLRRRQPSAPRPFRTPGYPWVPVAFLLGTTAGLGAIVWGEWGEGNYSPVVGLLIAVLGFPCFALWRRISAASRTPR